MTKQVATISLFVGFALLTGCAAPRAFTPSAGETSTVEACVNRGVAYFKEIGSYPRLATAPNAGRRAEDVARERCGRTTTAF